LERERAMRYLVVAAVLATVCGPGCGQEKTPAEAQGQRMSLDLKNAPLGKVLMEVAKSTKLSLILDPLAEVDGKAAKDARVTMEANQLTGAELVRDLTQPLWLETDLADGVVFIRNASLGGASRKGGSQGVMDPDVPQEVMARLMEAKVTQEGPAPLRKVTKDVVRGAGFTLRYDLRYHEAGDGPVTVFAVYDLPLAGWLNLVSRSEGFGWTVEGESIVITDRAKGPEFRLERKLRDTVVSFDFKDEPVMKAVDFLQTAATVNIIILDRAKIDPAKKVTLKMEGVTVEAAIRGLGTQLGLSPVISDRMVFLCDPESLKPQPPGPPPSPSRGGGWLLAGRATPADLEVREKIRKETVSVEFKNLPLKDALDELAEKGKVKIVLSGKAHPVTLKLNNVSVETALTLLAQQVGLKCSIVDGKVLVSDEDGIRKASKGDVR
jgi:hypothetical protein